MPNKCMNSGNIILLFELYRILVQHFSFVKDHSVDVPKSLYNFCSWSLAFLFTFRDFYAKF